MDECEETPGAPFPRLGCRCRACYYRRREDLPRSLVELAYGITDPYEISFSASYANRAIEAYLTGYLGLAEMQIELIKALMKALDEQVRANMALAPLGSLIIKAPEPPAA